MTKRAKTDSTRNERQARRREREKQWLKENGWQSWEALHTALMNRSAVLSLNAPEDQPHSHEAVDQIHFS